MPAIFGTGRGFGRDWKMAQHLLSARHVQTAQVGDHADGAGLFLRVSTAGSSWVLRFTAPNGRRREAGLGAAERDSLTSAGSTVAGENNRGKPRRASAGRDRCAAQGPTLQLKLVEPRTDARP